MAFRPVREELVLKGFAFALSFIAGTSKGMFNSVKCSWEQMILMNAIFKLINDVCNRSESVLKSSTPQRNSYFAFWTTSLQYRLTIVIINDRSINENPSRKKKAKEELMDFA